MKFYDQICNLAAERWSDNQRHISGDRDRAACLAKATDSVFCHLETEVDSGRLSAADEAECRRQADFVLEVYGFTIAEILLPSGSASAFSEIIEDIAQVTGIDHKTALRVHEEAEKELALYAQALANCPPDGHALLSAMVIGAKAKVEALSLLCQRLKTPVLPVSVAYSHDAADALNAGGCQSPGDYTTISMPGGYGDCLILHSRKAFGIWDALPKAHPDKCAPGYGAGSGMYIRD